MHKFHGIVILLREREDCHVEYAFGLEDEAAPEILVPSRILITIRELNCKQLAHIVGGLDRASEHFNQLFLCFGIHHLLVYFLHSRDSVAESILHGDVCLEQILDIIHLKMGVVKYFDGITNSVTHDEK